MSRKHNALRSLIAMTGMASILALTPACLVDESMPEDDLDLPTDLSEPVESEGDDAARVILDGVELTAEEFVALELPAVHFASTYESIRDGYVYAFTTEAERNDFTTDYLVEPMVKGTERELFKRKNSKFYDLTGYSQKYLELSRGESAVNLSTHPCSCNNDISSLKASETATWTTVYDLTNLSGDSWAIPSGSEISNLGNYYQSGGSTWNQDISSIRVSN